MRTRKPIVRLAAAAAVLTAAAAAQPRPRTDGEVAYRRVLSTVDACLAKHPDLVRRVALGCSHQGRELFVVRVSAARQDTHPEVWVGAAIHGSEGSEDDALFLLQRLLARATDPTTRDLLASRVLWIQPMVNPDGVVAQRRTNARGVDLNRNFAARWWPGPAASRRGKPNINYPGAEPFSEPETRAVRDFLSERTHLRAALDLHRSAPLVLAPQLGPAGEVTPRAQEAFAELDRVMGYHSVARTSGARDTVHFPGMHGLAIDWVWGELGVLAFTWETNYDPPDRGDDDPRWRGLLHVLTQCAEYPRARAGTRDSK
jgi:carboxypeptidase T